MQTPSPPNRTGTPGTAAATRSRSANPRQPAMLTGLTVPALTSMGPAEPMPTASTRPPARSRTFSISSVTTAHTASVP